MSKKTYIKTHRNRLLTAFAAAFLALSLAIGCFPASAYAAKEMFREVTSAGVTDIDAPVAGQKGDYTATVVNTGQYEITNIDYYEASTDRLKPSTEVFQYDTEYYVLVTLKAKSAYTFAFDTNSQSSLVAASCNGSAAMALSPDLSAPNSIMAIKAFFPKTESDPNASAPIDPVIPTENLVTAVNITGVTKPVPGQNPDTRYLNTNDSRVQIREAQWSTQSGKDLDAAEHFQYGESYTLSFYINVWSSYEFAKDYNHIFATPEKPMPAVTVTLDGASDVTVLPDYEKNAHMVFLKVAKVYPCDTQATINQIILGSVEDPAVGQAPNYTCSMSLDGYERIDMNDGVTQKGFTWQAVGDEALPTSASFRPQTSYQAVIRIKSKEGFQFQTNGSGSITASASMDGRTASVQGNASEAIVTCTFPQTGNLTVSQVAVTDLETPIAGQAPDYTVTYAGSEYGQSSQGSNTATSKNAISWYCEEDKKLLQTHEKFESSKTYTAQILIDTANGYEFRYQSGVIDINATLNSKRVKDMTSAHSGQVCLFYTFPKTQEHKCSPVKVDAIKATCKSAGKEAYYYCSECGRYFEDSKCTTQIPDISTWGVLPKTEHSGGKATCTKLAVCQNCNQEYGTLLAHNFSTTWEYKDDKGHAHKCKTCGALDTIKAHSSDTVKCGELAKCSECKMEYGQIVQHKWSKTPEYQDRKGHAFLCTVCGKHDTVSKHTPGPAATATTSQNCTVCGYMIAPNTKHTHKLSSVKEIKASCTTAGIRAHYACDSCNSIFSDSKGKQEIDDTDTLLIAATGHKESKWQSDADSHWKECTVKNCGEILAETKQAHDFSEKGRCSVCNYRIGSDAKGESNTDETNQTETVQPSESPASQEPSRLDPAEATDTADASNSTTTPSANTTIWIIIAIVAIVIAAGSVAAAALIVLKHKKSAEAPDSSEDPEASEESENAEEP